MHNFSSENIGRDRLTVRVWCCGKSKSVLNTYRFTHLSVLDSSRTVEYLPHQGVEAVCSSPQFKDNSLTLYTVPDLASSEMRFLQRPTYTPITRNEDNPVSKSRERERRRVEMQQDEISTFFKPRRAPLEEVAEKASTGTLSTSMSDEQPAVRRHISSHRYEKENTPYQAAGSPERRDPRPSEPACLSDPECIPRSHFRQLPSYRPDTPGNWSGKEATCVTWSDTQMSPIVSATSSRLGHVEQRQTSQIPDSIWTSIQNTGIFNGTGIVSKTAANRPRETTPLGDRPRTRKSPATSLNRNRPRGASGSITSSSSTLSGSHGQRSRPRDESSPPVAMSKIVAQKGEIYQQAAKYHDDEVRSRIADTPLISNQVDVDFRRQDPIASTAFQNLEILDPQASKSPPMTREQIGRKARIKLPRTTLPIPKASNEEIPQDGNEGHALNQNRPSSPEKAGQVNVPNTAAPAERTMAPDMASGNSVAEHEYRTEETVPPVQPTLSHHDPIITRPGSTLYTIEPAIRYPATETSDNERIVAKSSASLDRSARMQTSNIRVDSLPTFPTRGSFIGHTDRMIYWPSHLSPIAEHSRPDYHHLQRMHFHGLDQIPHGLDHMGEQCGEIFEDEKGEVIPFTEYLEYGLWEEERATVAPSENCIYGIHDEGLEELQLEGYCGGGPIASETWDQHEQVAFPMAEEPELWPGPENTMSNSQSVEGIFPRSALDPPYWNFGEDAKHEQANDEGESPMRGFWRPHRTY
jgi:hypothetical protein